MDTSWSAVIDEADTLHMFEIRGPRELLQREPRRHAAGELARPVDHDHRRIEGDETRSCVIVVY